MSIARGPSQALDGGAGPKMSAKNASLNNLNRQSGMAAGMNKAYKQKRNTSQPIDTGEVLKDRKQKNDNMNTGSNTCKETCIIF
jgi:hypothetical protein